MIQFGANFSILGVPETGLSPVITIRDTSDGSVVINAVAMTEVGGGAYKYDFTNDTAKKYSAVIDGGSDTLDSRYLSAWTERAKSEAEIVTILEDTNELQGNQGNWLTATGFATENPPSQTLDDYKANVSGLAPANEYDASMATLLSGITDLKDEAFGKWVLDHNADTLTLYRADGVSVLKIFDLTLATDIVPNYVGRVPQ